VSGQILLFGKLKDAFGSPTIDWPGSPTTVAELRAGLIARNPDLAGLLAARSMRIAVNQELVSDEAGWRLSPGDEVALMPPLSGG
jgi:molybdopterin converting factor small subunit